MSLTFMRCINTVHSWWDKKKKRNLSLNLNFLDLKKNSNIYLVKEIIIRANLNATVDEKAIIM